MDLGFGGEVADFYHQYRRGYPPAVLDTPATENSAALLTDVLVVGGGPAGTWAAIKAAQAGADVVLVDKGRCGSSGATAALTESLGRLHQPLEFGLRITTLVRGTAEEAWRDAEAKVAARAGTPRTSRNDTRGHRAVGQQRLLALAERGEVLDSCLYTTPGKFGGGGAETTWPAGSPGDVAAALRKYADLGVTHFVLSDTPYKREAARHAGQLLSRLRDKVAV